MNFPSINTTLKVVYRGSDNGVWKYPVVQMDTKALLYQPEDEYSRLCFWLNYPGMKESIKCNCIVDKEVAIDVDSYSLHHLFIQLKPLDYLFTGKLSTINEDETWNNWDIAARFLGNVNTEKVSCIDMFK
jgi:hypothetical protein